VAMQSIHQVTGQTVDGTGQAERAAEELNALSRSLRQTVGQ
jgi:methyl-accepting chemotaxis protein